MSFKTILFAAIFSTVAAATSFAASPTVIQVSLTGEGGSDMHIKLDQSKIKAGKVEFNVTNEAKTESHEMVLVKLKSADQTIPVLTDKHRIDESKVKSLGEVEGLEPGEHGKLTADLRPGSYQLLCNIKSHYESGMHTILTITK